MKIKYREFSTLKKKKKKSQHSITEGHFSISAYICAFSAGYYSVWQQPRVPLAFRLDGASQDLAAEAHPGRNHQTSL